MHEQWRMMYPDARTKKTFDSIDEVGLTTTDRSKKQCYRCKQWGHMAYECPDKDKTCETCGKQGHKAADCWQDPQNIDKAPEWFQKKHRKTTEDADEGKDGGDTGCVGIEVLLCSLEVNETSDEEPDISELLKDPNFWIADSGASVHSTPHLDKLENTVKIEAGRVVAMADGELAVIMGEGEAPGLLCDAFGEPQVEVRLTTVKGLPWTTYNAVSIPQLLAEGWYLSGDSNSLVLEKDGMKMTFGIKIPIGDGFVFGAFIMPDDSKIGEGEKNVVNDMPKRDSPARATEYLQWAITAYGGRLNCESRPVPQGQQKNTPQASEGEIQTPTYDERMKVSEDAEGETSDAATSETTSATETSNNLENTSELKEMKYDDEDKETVNEYKWCEAVKEELEMRESEKMKKLVMSKKEQKKQLVKREKVTMKLPDDGLETMNEKTKKECSKNMSESICEGQQKTNLFVIEGWQEFDIDGWSDSEVKQEIRDLTEQQCIEVNWMFADLFTKKFIGIDKYMMDDTEANKQGRVSDGACSLDGHKTDDGTNG
mmetsp:Transcript_2251/g.5079  ORF Transcript_2251/g.5079 Transcript_2251/m.5079 type:complete len:542 (+) Transcript_2251:775-2400(+)